MPKTDYAKIATRYDRNQFRHDIKPNPNLEEYLNHTNKEPVTILDLACGTGLYLQNQLQYFKECRNKKIEWHGLDASEEMPAQAKTRVTNVRFVKG